MSSPSSDSEYFDFAAFFNNTLPTDICAPHPDEFETEIDLSLANIHDHDLPLLFHDANEELWRSANHTYNGPSSVFTESTYDSLSSHGGSILNLPTSPTISYLNMEVQKFSLDSVSEYAPSSSLPDTVDPTSFGALPPTPPHSPPVPAAKFTRSFSEYGISVQPFFDSYTTDTTVSPSRVTGHVIPITNGLPHSHTTDDGTKFDPRKKYKCQTCTRSFARAYNLKTHMATHDPNRLKPHVCPHHSCARSFSRKHDLGRHLVSIHRDDQGPYHSTRRSIGVGRGPRVRCDSCGRDWVGRDKACACHVK